MTARDPRAPTQRQRHKARSVEAEKLRGMVTAWMGEHGARQTAEAALSPISHEVYGPDFELETKLGTLCVYVTHDYINCRFHDVARAVAHFGQSAHGRLNPYSGKWNFSEGIDGRAEGTFERFRVELSAILP